MKWKKTFFLDPVLNLPMTRLCCRRRTDGVTDGFEVPL